MRNRICLVLAGLVLFPAVTFAATFTHVLNVGSKGAEVAALQQILLSQGFFTASPTGYFGPLTAKAVASFQSSHNLEPVGYVGPQTRALLNNESAPFSGGIGTAPKQSTPASGNAALVAALMAQVKALQAQIAAILSGQGVAAATSPNRGSIAAGVPAIIQNYIPTAGGGGGGGGGTSPGSSNAIGSSGSSSGGGNSSGGSRQPPVNTTPPLITVTAPVSTLPLGTVNTTLVLTTDRNATCVYSTSQNANFNAGTTFTITGTTTHSTAITGLLNATSYTYYVECKDTTGNIGASSVSFSVAAPPVAAPDTIPPTAPGSLTAVAASTTQIALSWTASTDNVGVTGYQIFRNGGSTAIAQVTTLSYTDTSLTPSTQYAYIVKAIDAAGNLSAASNQASATTQALPNTTPPAVTINAPTANLAANTTQATLAVTTDKNAACAYSATAGFTFGAGTPFTTTGGTSHSTTLSGFQNSTSYTYYVKCQDQAGNISGDAFVTFAIATPPDTIPPPFQAIFQRPQSRAAKYHSLGPPRPTMSA